MRVGVYGYTGDPHTPVVPVLAGIGEMGDDATLIAPEEFKADAGHSFDAVVVFSLGIFGGAIWSYYRKRGVPVFVVEQGHTDRATQHVPGAQWERKYHQFGIDGLNWLPAHAPDDRREALGIDYKKASWGKRDGYILFLAQKPGDAQHGGVNVRQFLQDAMTEARQHTQRAFVYRIHPKDATGALPEGDYFTHRPSDMTLQESFDGAHSVVTFNSNGGLHAVLRGIPTFCTRSAIYADMACSDLSKIDTGYTPDRDVWINTMNRIAYAQWTEPELATGQPWAYLKLQAGL